MFYECSKLFFFYLRKCVFYSFLIRSCNDIKFYISLFRFASSPNSDITNVPVARIGGVAHFSPRLKEAPIRNIVKENY